MPHLRIAIDLSSFRLRLKEALRQAARLGADGVQIDARGEISPHTLSQTGLRSLRKTLDDLHLRVAAVSFRTRRGYHDPADLTPRIEATKAAMDLAHRLGASLVVNRVGRIPADADSPAMEMLVEVLTDLAHYGNRAGALLAAETGTESGAEMARLFQRLPEGTIGVALNPGNLAAGGYSPLEAVEALGPWILHVHAGDGVCDPATRRGKHVALGQGSADLPAVLAALDEHGYRGYLTVGQDSAQDRTEEIAAAIKFLRGL